MEKLVPLMNELQEILHQSNMSNSIDLPQIVVVGAQSTGKSSVLESIIGRDILPRGSGIVTRRPTIIQLFHEEIEEEWAEFTHNKGIKITDFSQIKREIEKETEKVAGMNKGISETPIILKIHSPRVIDLSLVDLPGITKIPIGDQPADIENQIRNMVLSFVKHPNCIILALTAANTDLANSDSLKLAREADPDGVRTIGVVTKIDLMDEGTDALEILQGKVYPLKLGYVGVVCRSQKDISSQKSILEALTAERAFFDNHKTYKKYAEKLGIPYLLKVLNLTLIKHIKRSIPQLRETLLQLAESKEVELAQYGDVLIDENSDKTAKGLYLLTLLNKYTQAFIEMINGKYIHSTYHELSGGARINYILTEIFKKTINDINPFEVLHDDEIRTAIKNANGLTPSLFLPEGAFENLIRQQIIRLQEPSLECSHLVYEELRRLLFLINIPEVARYDLLGQRIVNVMEVVLQRCLVPTDQMIRNLIEIELGYVNTYHPDFIGAASLMGVISQEESGRNQMRGGGEESASESGLPKADSRKPPSASHRHSETDSKGPAGGGQPAQNNVAGHHHPSGNAQPPAPTSSNNNGGTLWSFFGWSPSKRVEEFDAKLSKKKDISAEENRQVLLDKELENTELNMSKSQLFTGSKAPDMLYYISRGTLEQQQGLVGAGVIPHLPPAPKTIRISETPSRREQMEVSLIKRLIVSYFDVVKKNVNDSVPKTVITFLVNKVKGICERELVANLYKETTFDALLQENTYIAKQREESKYQLLTLKKSLNILNEFESKY